MTLADCRTWLAGLAEAEAMLPARVVLERLPIEEPELLVEERPPVTVDVEATWLEKLWTVPAESRLGVHEVAEALSRSKSWVYKRTASAAEDPIPHRRLDGELTFTAGEVRAWIREREDVLVAGRMDHEVPSERLRA